MNSNFAKISVVHNRLNYKSKSGFTPVYLRIYLDGKADFVKIHEVPPIYKRDWVGNVAQQIYVVNPVINRKIKEVLDGIREWTMGKTLNGHLLTIKEIKDLPQIIGSDDDESYNQAKELFDKVCSKTIRLNYIEAELAKLFTNSYRYANFALANEYFIISTSLGGNIYKIIDAVNDDYPRANINKPGFAKGPCLGKDTWLLLNSLPNMSTFNSIISSSYRVNEGLPALLIDKVKTLTDLKNKKIVVLGLTFKKDCDDARDSLSLKLVHLLKNEFVDVITHDPYVDNKDVNEVIKEADVIFIATNHSAYESIDFSKQAKKGTIMVDIWNVTKKDNYLYVV